MVDVVVDCRRFETGSAAGVCQPFRRSSATRPTRALVARGRAVYDTECRSCHGADLRGGERAGPNLLRVAGRAERSRRRADRSRCFRARTRNACGSRALRPEDVKALAAYIHSVLALAPGQGAPPPGPPVELKVLVGDAAAGERYFAAQCATCHSVTGDLKGIGARDLGPRSFRISGLPEGEEAGEAAADGAGPARRRR